MKNFFKENLALIVGVALPFLLAGLFFVAGSIAQQQVDDPRFALILIKDYYENPDLPWSIGIDKGRLAVSIRPIKDKDKANLSYMAVPAVYILEPGTENARKLDIPLDTATPGPVTSKDIETVNRSGRISTDLVAPDGYRFEYNSGYNGSLLGEIFGMRYASSSSTAYVLVKPPRRMAVKGLDALQNATFLGWIVPPDDPVP